MTRWIWLEVFVGACVSGGGAAVAPSAPATQRALPPASSGPATHVVTLAPGSPTPVVRGPFEILCARSGRTEPITQGFSGH